MLSRVPTQRIRTSWSPLRRFLSSVAVKKVTRSNFEAVLEELRGVVRESDFVAFDLEMSGVASAPWRDSSPLDDPHIQYLKLRDSARKFAALQFGLCPFRWDPCKGSFVARPYNFYLSPHSDIQVDGSSSEFLCQTSSLEFLAKHQFDFNVWIREGITYLSMAQESEAQEAFHSMHERKINSVDTLDGSIEVPLDRTADVLFAERMKNKLLEWRNGILKGCAVGKNPDCPGKQFKTFFFKMRPAILLDDLSSHQLKLIQMVVRKYFQDLVFIHSNTESSMRRMIVYSSADNDKTLLMKEARDDFWRMKKERLKSAVGFRYVIDLLATERKLMVGHSCILDIVHLHNKFLGPLPSTITEFAKTFHAYFPHVIDTKQLLESSGSFQHLLDKKGCKSLSSLFARLCPEWPTQPNLPFHPLLKIEVLEDETGSWNSGVKHEAGFDAFMTGAVFAQACAYIGIDFKLQPLELSKHDKLQKYENLVCLNRRNETVIDLKTGVETLQSVVHPGKRVYQKVNAANIILLWGFSPEIKPSNLKQCLSKVYGPDSVASVFFLDETSALLQFSKSELVEKFLRLKDSLERNNNVISVLHPLAILLQGGGTRAASYAVYREICNSSVSKFMFADQAEAVGITWMTKFETDDLEANRTDENRPFGSKNGTGENRGYSYETNGNSGGEINFPSGSGAQLSYKTILDTLYGFR